MDRLLSEQRSVLVQPYQHQVDAWGETALIYFGDEFHHAINKSALLTVGGSPVDLDRDELISPATATAAEREVAESVLDACGCRDRLIYARVDLVPGLGAAPLLIELELCEPALFLAEGAGAAARFAEVIEGWLGAEI